MTGHQPTELQASSLALAMQHLTQAMDILEAEGLGVAAAHAQHAHDICAAEAAAHRK